MRPAVFALLLPLGMTLACDDSDATGPIVPVAAATVVATGSLQFSPATVNLLQNGTVTWQFNPTGHSVNFSTAGSPGDIAITFGGQVGRTFPTVGTFSYTCDVHGPSMSGVIIVHAP